MATLSSEDYTMGYGKINVVDALSHFYNKVKAAGSGPCQPLITKRPPCAPATTPAPVPATDIHPEWRWIVHYIPEVITTVSYGRVCNGPLSPMGNNTNYSYKLHLIDNYGQIYIATSANMSSWILDYDAAPLLALPQLPNCAIDFCKKLDSVNNASALLQFHAEQYQASTCSR
jgi:hypothetical protein